MAWQALFYWSACTSLGWCRDVWGAFQGLAKLLADNAPHSFKEMPFDSFFGRKIAVDASMHIYQFLVRAPSWDLDSGTVSFDEVTEAQPHACMPLRYNTWGQAILWNTPNICSICMLSGQINDYWVRRRSWGGLGISCSPLRLEKLLGMAPRSDETGHGAYSRPCFMFNANGPTKSFNRAEKFAY